MTNLDSALENAKLPERTVPLCLRGDLVADYEDLERQLAAEKDVDSLAGNEHARDLQVQLDALAEQMADSTVVLRVRALSNRAWHGLVAQHEARENNQLDAAYGFNLETLAPELVKACLTPRLEPDQLEKLFGVLSNGQFEQLFLAAHGASRGRVDIPKSLNGSGSPVRPGATPN